jgi:hypothetical protein
VEPEAVELEGASKDSHAAASEPEAAESKSKV